MTLEEIKLKSLRTTEGAAEIKDEDMKPSVDTIEVGKIQAAINLGRYQDETQRWINKKVKPREIKEGDLLRRIPKAKQKGKTYNKWEGPFLVASMARPEAS